jgi:hypothetical protein
VELQTNNRLMLVELPDRLLELFDKLRTLERGMNWTTVACGEIRKSSC